MGISTPWLNTVGKKSLTENFIVCKTHPNVRAGKKVIVFSHGHVFDKTFKATGKKTAKWTN